MSKQPKQDEEPLSKLAYAVTKRGLAGMNECIATMLADKYPDTAELANLTHKASQILNAARMQEKAERVELSLAAIVEYARRCTASQRADIVRAITEVDRRGSVLA